MDFLKNLTSTLGSAAQGVGNFFNQQLSPAVQRFGQMAAQDLSKAPIVGGATPQEAGLVLGPVVKNFVQGAEGAANGIGQVAQGVGQQGLGYFDPNNVGSTNAPKPNFWTTPFAQELGGQAPLPKFDFAEQINKNAGGGLPGAAASFLPGMAEGFMNVPSQIGQFSVDTANAIDNGSILNPQKAFGLAAEFATPMLTVATAGKAPELLSGVKDLGWGMSALKGLLNGTAYGAAFGGLQGLQENQNAATIGQQFDKTLPYIWNGMVTGGTLGTVLGPSGKFFFGNTEPGQTATLAQHGLIPPDTMTDAYKILNVSPDATLPEIRQAYTNALQEFHPQNGGTPESLAALNNAYEMTTRNTAPTVNFDQGGTPQVNFSDEFGGGSLTQQQVAEARRAAADHTAFQARIANLKAGRLPIKNPEQPAGVVTQDDFLTHGADLLTPEGQQAISAKTQQAAANQPAFHNLLSTIAEQFNGRSLSNIKNPESMAQKIVEHRMAGDNGYGLPDVQDALRGTIVVNKEQVPQVVQALKDQLQTQGWQRKGNGADYFANPEPNGYEGYHLTIGMPDGQLAEIQIHTPQSFANAKLTHDVYSVYNDSSLPKPLKAQLKTLQAKIKTDPTAKLEAQTRQYEATHPSKALNPMESDFTGSQQPTTEAGAIAQRLQEANPETSYPELNAQEQRSQQQQAAVDQARVKLGQPTTAEDIGRQGVQQAQEWNQLANQRHYVDNLVRIRDGLQARVEGEAPTSTPEIDGLLKMRGQLQDEVNKARMFVDQNRNNPAVGRTLARPGEVRAHISDLNKSIKNIDDQVKSMRVRLKAQHQQTTEGLKEQITNLNKQIEDQQGKLRVKTATTQPVQLPNDFRDRVQIRDIANRPAPETGTQEAETPNAQSAQKTAAQQAFAQTKGTQQTAEQTAKTQPLPNGVVKENGVFTFSPVEGGPAQTGTPSELGLKPSGKSKGMWEDEKGNQYSASYNPEVERNYKKQAGLPTLRTPEEVMQGTNGKIKVASGKNRGAFMNAVNYLGIPMDLTLSRSPDVNARIAGYGIVDAQNYESYLTNRWQTILENGKKGLSDAEIENAAKVKEGLAAPMSPGAARYAQAMKTVTDEADVLAKKAGVMTRNEDGTQQAYQSMPNYFPHTWTQAQWDAMADQKGNTPEGMQFRKKGQLYTSRFGNMEQHRGQGMEGVPYRLDGDVMQEYAESAAHKIATTSVFGANSEKAASLIQSMLANGNDADASTFKKALEVNGIAQGPNDITDPTEKLATNAMQAIRAGIDFTNLGGVTGVHHLTVEPGIISQYGVKNALRAVPDFLKAFVGNPSEFARENVSRLHASEPTGLASSAMGKFYKVIQLDRVLNAFSAQTAKAADLNIGAMEKNLADPSVRTNILQAGLPYDDIAKRGYFTPEERHAYIQAGLKNAGLLFTPDSISKAATNPIGKAIMALSTPITARTQRQIPFLFHQIQDNKNFSPAVKWALSAMLLGTVSRIASNLIQNHPQGTPQQLLTEGALSGMGVNYGPVSTTGIADMMQYPEYAGPIAAGMIAGPLGSMTANGIQAYQNINSPKASDQNTGKRELTRYLPIVGPTVANTLFPAKSWVGNRPADLVKILATGNQPQQQQGITVQHSPLDLVRANPQVAAQQAKLGTMYDAQNAALAKLNPTQSTNYAAMKNAFSTGDYATGYKLLAQDPALYDARAAVEQASAKANGTKVSPLYDPANKQQALNFLKFQTMDGVHQATYLRNDTGPIAMEREIDQYNQDPKVQAANKQAAAAAGSHYTPFTPNPLFSTNSQTGKPLFSDQDVAAYRVYQNLPTTGTDKVDWIGNHPQILGEQLATYHYSLQKLQTAWDNRPAGQSIGEFAATHNSSLFGGIDQNGKVIPAYNLFDEPKYKVYMADPQKGAVIAAYNAYVANKNYTAADSLAAQNSNWFPLYQQANKLYNNAHPYNSDTAGQLGGSGINFGSTGGSGGGGYGSSSYMQNYLAREELYGVLNSTMKQPTPLKFQGESPAIARQNAALLKSLPQSQASILKLLQTTPKLEKLPTLKAPKVTMPKLGFKPNPTIPQGSQGKVEAGRLMTKLS